MSIKSRIVTVKGPRGELVRNFKHCSIDMQLVDGGDMLLLDMWFAKKKQLSTLGSLKSHITNMMIGVVQVRYQLPQSQALRGVVACAPCSTVGGMASHSAMWHARE